MKNAFAVPVLCLIFLNGCDQDLWPGMIPFDSLYDSPSFECVHEPGLHSTPDTRVDRLYQYGKYRLQKDGLDSISEVARYYRVAAANGHAQASNDLQKLLINKVVSSPNSILETMELVLSQMEDGVPSGFFNFGRYAESGFGAKTDFEFAQVYYRYAADLGNPEAQFRSSTLLYDAQGDSDVRRKMMICAMEQHHAGAAYEVARFTYAGGDEEQAIRLYHEAVKGGSILAAVALERVFLARDTNGGGSVNRTMPDVERARRYRSISEFFEEHVQDGPTLSDIEDIVPLPPAQLPAWDGSFLWIKQRSSPSLVVRPTEGLVRHLSELKKLDFKTGLPRKWTM